MFNDWTKFAAFRMFLRSLLHRLTDPHPQVPEMDRFLARTLSTLLLATLVVGTSIQLILFFQAEDAGVRWVVGSGLAYAAILLLIPYGVSRTVHFRIASLIAVAGFDIALVLSNLSGSTAAGGGDAESFAAFGIVPIAFASLFFPLSVAITVVLLHTIGLLTTPFWITGQTFTDLLLNGFPIHFFISILLLVGAQQRNHLERLRQLDLRRNNDRLEHLVAERTADLNRTGEELQALSNRLARVEEEERRHLSTVLHDQIGSELAALNFSLHVMLEQLSEESRRAIGDQLVESATLVTATADSIRNVIAEMRPPVLDDYGLPAAVHWVVERFQRRSRVTVQLSDNFPTQTFHLEPDVEIAMLRIVQEALHNVDKHASASSVQIEILLAENFLRMVIVDDGRGFNPRDVPRPSEGGGIGLIALRERAASVDGTLTILSQPGVGTTLKIEVPL